MSLAELRAAAKSAGLPVSGNKSILMNRLQGARPTPSIAKKSSPTPKSGASTATAVRVGVQLSDSVLKEMKLRLTGVGTDAAGNNEYIYMPTGGASPKQVTTKTASTSSAKTTGTSNGKSKVKATGKGTTPMAMVSDEALEEATNLFVYRLNEKKVPVELCRKVLLCFMDETDIPKQKTLVYETLAEQTHYETDSDDSDGE
jgi:hypothetical protein